MKKIFYRSVNYLFLKITIRTILLALFLVVGLGAEKVEGAPSISGIAGNFLDDENITINGSGFGENGPNVLLFDNFENGTVGNQISTNIIPPVGRWSSVTSAGWTSYSNLNKISGNLAARFDANNYPENSHPVLVVDAPMTFDSFYVSWWELIPLGDRIPGCDGYGGCNWKTIWVASNDGNVNDADVTLNSNGAQTWLIFGNDYPNIYSTYFSFSLISGVWHRFQFYIKGATDSSGQELVWVTDAENGTRKVKDRNVATLNIGDNNKRQRFYVNGYVRDTTDSHPTFDDVYIAYGENAQARVEIGDKNTYVNCENLTAVTPVSWSDTNISGIVRLGSIKPGSAYLYVTDSAGAVNGNGYPITIAGDQDPLAPVSPHGLSVY